METRTIGNRTVTLIMYMLFIGGMNMFAFGAGIFYPKIVFSFKNIDDNFYWGAADKACDLASELTPEINVLFRRPGNTFKAEFFPVFLTKKNYSKLYIKEIKYIYESKEISVLNDSIFILPHQIVEIGSNQSGWITNGTYYWLNGRSANPENGKNSAEIWPKTNIEKLFLGRKIGEEFLFSIKIVYRFDNENEKTQMIYFVVKTLEGKYVSPFAGS